MLRRLLITAGTLLFLASLDAQSPDFAPLGAKWYYSEQAFIPPPFGEFPHVVEVVAKETYQGRLCSKLTGVASGTVPEPLYMYTQNDSVFFYSLLSDRFELLYDFGAQPGEAWTIGGLGTPGGYDSLRVQVDSISQITVGGTVLRVQHISYPLVPYEWGFEVIEGVGSPFFLTPDYGLYEGGPIGLRCFLSPTVDLHFVPYPCDTIIGTSSLPGLEPSRTISLRPNPNQGSTELTWPQEAGSGTLEVFDLEGLLVVQQQVTLDSGKAMLRLDGWSKGVYVVRLSAPRWVSTRKLVLE
jgi:hypothetical protein